MARNTEEPVEGIVVTAADLNTTAVAVRDSAELLERDDTAVSLRSRSYVDTVEDLGVDDVKVPQLRLAQGLTNEVTAGDAQMGQWVLTGAEAIDSLTFIPLRMAHAREYRDKEDFTLLCASPDAKAGMPMSGADPEEVGFGGVCAKCPMSQWTPIVNRDGSKRNVPPACTDLYSYVGWSVEHDQVVAVDFKRTSIDAAKYINTTLRVRFEKGENPFGAFAIRMASRVQKGAKGTFAVPVLQTVPVDESVLEVARQAAALVS